MSLLWRDRIGIALGPERVALVRLARGLRPRVMAKRCEAVAPQTGGEPWRAALDKLVKILGEPEWQNAGATVVLSNHFVRYACIPWNKNVSGEDEQLALARHRFTQIYGDAAQEWQLRLSHAQGDAPTLASAVDTGLLGAVRQSLAQNKLDLLSIQPYLMAGFNRYASRINKDNVWFAAVEAGKLCLALLKGGQWSHVQMYRDDDRMETLKAWLDRENLASELEKPCHEVLLFAPESAKEQDSISPYRVQRLDMPACHGFSPVTDTQYAMALSGVM